MKSEFLKVTKITMLFPLCCGFLLCCSPKLGPDKQAYGAAEGSASGALTGAVTGFQVGSSTGAGALVGAGFGALAGAVQGHSQDALEHALILISNEIQKTKEEAFAEEVLAMQLRRRNALFPSRDIFPADIFFRSDERQLSPEGKAVLRVIYRLNKDRLPWSRFGIASYILSNSPDSSYARHLSRKRGRAIGDYLVSLGMEPRRLSIVSAIRTEPLVKGSPEDERFGHAIEFFPKDIPNAPMENASKFEVEDE